MFEIDPETDLGLALASYDRRANLLASCLLAGLEVPILADEPIEVLNPLAHRLAAAGEGDRSVILDFAARHLPIDLAVFVMACHGVEVETAIQAVATKEKVRC